MGNTFKRMATKEFTCNKCLGRIYRGETYVDIEYRDKMNENWLHNRYHLHCHNKGVSETYRPEPVIKNPFSRIYDRLHNEGAFPVYSTRDQDYGTKYWCVGLQFSSEAEQYVTLATWNNHNLFAVAKDDIKWYLDFEGRSL